MSSWIRGNEQPEWHRIDDEEYEAGFERGEFRLLCGLSFPTWTGWSDAVPELVPPDDRHRPCWERAEREARWAARWNGGDAVRVVRDLAQDAAPDLAPFQVILRLTPRPVLSVRTATGELVSGTGLSLAAAAGDVLAKLETRGR